MEPIDELDETGAALRVLLILHREGPLSRTVLIGKTARGKQAVYTALRVLQRLGLVGEERRKGFPNTVLTSLTERGEKVARRVGEIERLLKAGD
jgi:DNA-binding MarR family transcriptional regulator